MTEPDLQISRKGIAVRIAVLTLPCLLLAGCTAMKTHDEMVAGAASSARVCSVGLTPAEAIDRLRVAWDRCFVRPRSMGVAIVGSTVSVYEQSRVVLSQEKVKDTTVLAARIASRRGDIPSPLSHSILLMADARQTDECRAEVVVRAANTHWQKRANVTERWLAEPLLLAPEAECGRP